MRVLTVVLILLGLAMVSGEEGEDVQLVLGDDTQETQDCADELQLEIEDLFEEVDVVQDLDTDEAEGYSFDTDAGYYVIIYLNNEIVNGNCSAVIEDVLDVIDVPQVQVYIRGSSDHHHTYSSSSSSSKSRRYWKLKSFRGYHKRSTSDDYGWRRNKHGRWWHKKRSKGRSRSRSSMDGYLKKKMWWWAKKKQHMTRKEFRDWYEKKYGSSGSKSFDDYDSASKQSSSGDKKSSSGDKKKTSGSKYGDADSKGSGDGKKKESSKEPSKKKKKTPTKSSLRSPKPKQSSKKKDASKKSRPKKKEKQTSKKKKKMKKVVVKKKPPKPKPKKKKKGKAQEDDK